MSRKWGRTEVNTGPKIPKITFDSINGIMELFRKIVRVMADRLKIPSFGSFSILRTLILKYMRGDKRKLFEVSSNSFRSFSELAHYM